MSLKLGFSLTQIEYTLAVQRFGHFSKAAQHCLVTQPTLSMQIQKLEETLGIVIFDRSKKPVLTTTAGKLVMAQMQSILSEARKLELITKESVSGALDGEIRLGVIPTVSPYLLPKLLPTVERLYPRLKLKIYEMQTHRIVEALNDDEIDAGLLATPLKISQIHERALYWEPFFVLCRKSHELSKSKKVKYSMLSADDIWLLEEGHCLRHQVLDVCAMKNQKRVERRYLFESGSLESLKNLVESYGGYTLLPLLAAINLGPKVSLIAFERPIPAREIGLVTRRNHFKASLIEALAAAILNSLPETIGRLRAKDLDVLEVD